MLSAVLSLWLPDSAGRPAAIHRHLHQSSAPIGSLVNCAKEVSRTITKPIVPTLLVTILPAGRTTASIGDEGWIQEKWLAALRSVKPNFHAASTTAFVWATKASETGILGLTPQQIELSILASSAEKPASNLVVCDEPLPYCPPPLASLSGRALSAWRREVGNGHSLPDSLMWHAWAAQALRGDKEKIASAHQMGDSRRVEQEQDGRRARRLPIDDVIRGIEAGEYSDQELQRMIDSANQRQSTCGVVPKDSLAAAVTPERSKSVSIGNRIRDLRKERGYGVREFARLVGMNHSNLLHLEDDKNSPTISTLEPIASALQVSLAELLGGCK